MTKQLTSDNIRALAAWAEKLGLSAQQTALYGLYHQMTVTKSATAEQINATAMTAIAVIGSVDKNKTAFYQTLKAWGIN